MTNSKENEKKYIVDKSSHISTLNNSLDKSMKPKTNKVNDNPDNQQVDLQSSSDIISHSKSDQILTSNLNPNDNDIEPDTKSDDKDSEILKTESTMDTHHDNSMKQFNIDRFSNDKMKEIEDAMKMFNFDLMEEGGGLNCKDGKNHLNPNLKKKES